MAKGLSYDVFSFLRMKNQKDDPLPEPDIESDILLRLMDELSLEHLERYSPYWIRTMYPYMSYYRGYNWYSAVVQPGIYQICIPYPCLEGLDYQVASATMVDAVPAPTALIVSAMMCIAQTIPMPTFWCDYPGKIFRAAEEADVCINYMHAGIRRRLDQKIEIFPVADTYTSTLVHMAGLRTQKSAS